jgi:hypothetical protein
MKVTLKNIVIASLLLSVGFTSCLKDSKVPSDPSNGSGTNNVVEFQNSSVPVSYTSVFPEYNTSLIFAPDTAGFNIVVNYAGAEEFAPQDITVTLALSQTLLDSFNSNTSNTYIIPPTDVIYSYPTTLVIPKGKSQVVGRAVIKKAADFDFSANYALPLTITKSSYGIISSNYGTAIYSFAGRNSYDGIYSYKGYALRAGDGTLTGSFTGKSMNLVTINATSVQFASYALWGDGASGIGIGYPILKVDPTTNAVTVSSSGGAINNPSYSSRYDPSSKTFYVSFTWGAGPSSRLSIDTLTYVSARP